MPASPAYTRLSVCSIRAGRAMARGPEPVNELAATVWQLPGHPVSGRKIREAWIGHCRRAGGHKASSGVTVPNP